MNFIDFKHILSNDRLQRYLIACGNDTRKTMTLYRLNLNLSQEVFTLLSCFEVALRNAITIIRTYLTSWMASTFCVIALHTMNRFVFYATSLRLAHYTY
jgi:hypothetical protein